METKLETKKCSRCQQFKPKSSFNRNKNTCSGLGCYCKECKRTMYESYRENNEQWFIRKVLNDKLKLYGADLDWFCAQGDTCAICGQKETRIHNLSGKVTTLSIDHCHRTKKARGLLCNRCNKAIGSLGDDIALIEKALNYLKKHDLQS